MSVNTESKLTMEAPMIVPLKKINGITGRCKRKSRNIRTAQRAAICQCFQSNNGKKGEFSFSKRIKE